MYSVWAHSSGQALEVYPVLLNTLRAASWLRNDQHLLDNPDSVSTLGRTELEGRMVRTR